MIKRDLKPHLPQVQDKDELTMKKLKTEGGDKDGIKDAEVCALLMGPFFLLSRLIFIPLCHYLWERSHISIISG